MINHQSTVFLFDADTGRAHAMVGGNLLTAFRTAAASAVSIRYLAREDARVLGMIGAGHQAAFQLRAALEQRAFEKVIGWNLHPEMLPNLEKVADEVGVPFEAVELGGMREADVIISITSSFEAILGADQVAPGTHLACMGTDTKGKQEVAPELLARAVVFTDEVAQSVSIGEAQHAVAQGLIGEGDVQQLGAVINGAHPGAAECGGDHAVRWHGRGVAGPGGGVSGGGTGAGAGAGDGGGFLRAGLAEGVALSR